MTCFIKKIFQKSGVLGLIGMGFFSGLAINASTEAFRPKINFDPQVLSRDIGKISSFAPILKKVTPAVVTVFSTKKVRMPGPADSPFFSDPFFRSFLERNHRARPPMQDDGAQAGLGSGVVVSKDGYILTNHHVVAIADEVKVSFSDSKKSFNAKIIGTDPKTDLAVLKIDSDREIVPVTFADSTQVQVGDVVLALGNPFGIGQTVTSGIISALDRNLPGSEGSMTDLVGQFLQTDAPINPGNSGGALLDTEGRLVGVNSAILSQSGGNIGIGFAIPSNLARSIFEQIVQKGRVTRSYLGVAIQETENEKGLRVQDLVPQSPAEDAGIRRGDIIIELNGKPVDAPHTLRQAISQSEPGSLATLTIIREGKTHKISVMLREQKSS